MWPRMARSRASCFKAPPPPAGRSSRNGPARWEIAMRSCRGSPFAAAIGRSRAGPRTWRHDCPTVAGNPPPDIGPVSLPPGTSLLAVSRRAGARTLRRWARAFWPAHRALAPTRSNPGTITESDRLPKGIRSVRRSASSALRRLPRALLFRQTESSRRLFQVAAASMRGIRQGKNEGSPLGSRKRSSWRRSAVRFAYSKIRENPRIRGEKQVFCRGFRGFSRIEEIAAVFSGIRFGGFSPGPFCR